MIYAKRNFFEYFFHLYNNFSLNINYLHLYLIGVFVLSIHFLLADTISIMGRRISSCIPGISIMFSGGCGSTIWFIIKPFESSVFRYVVSVLWYFVTFSPKTQLSVCPHNNNYPPENAVFLLFVIIPVLCSMSSKNRMFNRKN